MGTYYRWTKLWAKMYVFKALMLDKKKTWQHMLLKIKHKKQEQTERTGNSVSGTHAAKGRKLMICETERKQAAVRAEKDCQP